MLPTRGKTSPAASGFGMGVLTVRTPLPPGVCRCVHRKAGAFSFELLGGWLLASALNGIHPPQRTYQDSVGKWDLGTIENSIASFVVSTLGCGRCSGVFRWTDLSERFCGA